MSHYQFVVEYYTHRLWTVGVKVAPPGSRIERQNSIAPGHVPGYLAKITGASKAMSPRQIGLMDQHVRKEGWAMVDFVNDMWVVTPVDKEKSALQTPERKMFFASRIAAKYILKKIS